MKRHRCNEADTSEWANTTTSITDIALVGITSSQQGGPAVWMTNIQVSD